MARPNHQKDSSDKKEAGVELSSGNSSDEAGIRFSKDFSNDSYNGVEAKKFSRQSAGRSLLVITAPKSQLEIQQRNQAFERGRV